MSVSLENYLSEMLTKYKPQLEDGWEELIVNVEVVDEELDVVACLKTDDAHSQKMLSDVDGMNEFMTPVMEILAAKQEKKGELTEVKFSITNDMVVGIDLHFQNDE